MWKIMDVQHGKNVQKVCLLEPFRDEHDMKILLRSSSWKQVLKIVQDC